MNLTKDKSGMNKVIKAVTIGCLLGAIICMIITAATAFVFTKAGILPIDFIGTMMTVIIGISAFFGAYTALRLSKSNGLIIGFIVGLFMFIVVVTAGVLSLNKTTTGDILTKAAVIIISGCLGGVIGVNRRTKKYVKR